MDTQIVVVELQAPQLDALKVQEIMSYTARVCSRVVRDSDNTEDFKANLARKLYIFGEFDVRFRDPTGEPSNLEESRLVVMTLTSRERVH